MPTGYTSCVEKGVTFEKFAMGCARAFGACVTMRDDDSDKPIPEEFKPSDYHVKEIEKAKKQLAALKKISDKEAEKRAGAEWSSERAQYIKLIIKAEELEKKYRKLRAEVEAWEPPSKDHVEFKNFMLEQIDSSIKFDCGTEYYKQELAKIRTLSAEVWRTSAVKKAEGDVAYHVKEDREERERVAGRNKWLRELRSSLATHNEAPVPQV